MEIFIILTILFLISASIVVFDNQLIRAKKRGEVPPDESNPPSWVGLVYWVWIGLGIALLLTNWKYAIYVFIAFVIFSFFGILEIAGNIIMSLFKPKPKK